MKFIYALKCPVEDVVRYIGKSDEPETRLRQHIKKALRGETKHHCARWIKRLHEDGKKPELLILCILPDDGPWQSVEKLLIAFARESGFKLTNITEGGDGVLFADTEARARQVAGRRETMSDPDRRAQWIATIVDANKQPETLQRKSASAKLAWNDPEKRARHLAGFNTAEVLARCSEKSLAAWADPESAERMRSGTKAAMAKPEVKAKMSASAKAMHANPEIQARITASLKAAHTRPETKARQIAAVTEVGGHAPKSRPNGPRP